MATYFIIETVTREGMTTVSDAPSRAAEGGALAERLGVTVKEVFFTPGPFDFISKVEAERAEDVEAFVMAMRQTGNIEAYSVRAYTPDEWAGMVRRLG